PHYSRSRTTSETTNVKVWYLPTEVTAVLLAIADMGRLSGRQVEPGLSEDGEDQIAWLLERLV
ncbi:MAG: hypothetical protein J2P54_17735, partial [Bradyrhizobiaceae bacterium]|nr:hypothetical protein [Bradyrhizobiaceae bacterium]